MMYMKDNSVYNNCIQMSLCNTVYVFKTIDILYYSENTIQLINLDIIHR